MVIHLDNQKDFSRFVYPLNVVDGYSERYTVQ